MEGVLNIPDINRGTQTETEISFFFRTVQSDIFIWIHLGYILDNYSFFWVLLLGCIAHHNHEPCQQLWQRYRPAEILEM